MGLSENHGTGNGNRKTADGNSHEQHKGTAPESAPSEAQLSEGSMPSREIFIGGSPRTNHIRQTLREISQGKQEGTLIEHEKNNGGRSPNEFPKMRIRAHAESGVAEITFNAKKRGKFVQLLVELPPETAAETIQDWGESFETSQARANKIQAPNASVFKGPVTATTITRILEDSTIVNITGNGLTWLPPQKNGSRDPFAALRTLPNVEIGFSKNEKEFHFRDTVLIDPSIGQYGQKESYLQSCTVHRTQQQDASSDPATASRGKEHHSDTTEISETETKSTEEQPSANDSEKRSAQDPSESAPLPSESTAEKKEESPADSSSSPSDPAPAEGGRSSKESAPTKAEPAEKKEGNPSESSSSPDPAPAERGRSSKESAPTKAEPAEKKEGPPSESSSSPDPAPAEEGGAPKESSPAEPAPENDTTPSPREGLDRMQQYFAISKERLEKARTRDRSSIKFRSFQPDSSEEMLPRQLQKAQLSMLPGEIATVRLTFNGNNLPTNGRSRERNTVFEVSFSTRDLDENETLELGDRLLKSIRAAHYNKDSDSSALKKGRCLTESGTVQGLLSVLKKQHPAGSISQVFLENAYLDMGPPHGRSSIFAGATLGSTTLLEAAHSPETVRNRPGISNCIIKNAQFAALAGAFTNTKLDTLDLRGSHINISADESCSISRLSAIGATVCGEINCQISGDFRRARLGTKDDPLGGSAFQTRDGELLHESLAQIRNFVVDTKSVGTNDSESKVIMLNGEEIHLDQIKDKVSQHTVTQLSNNANYYIEETIDTGKQWADALARYSSLVSIEQESDPQILRASHKRFNATVVLHGGDSSEDILRVDIRAATDGAGNNGQKVHFNLKNAYGETALYALKRLLIRYEEEAAIFLQASRNKQTKSHSTSSEPAATPTGAAAASSAGAQSNPRVEKENETMVLNTTPENEKNETDEK